MKITILTLFPEMFEGFMTTSIIKKAILKEIVEIETIDMRSYTKNKHTRVDDYPFGGGQGLVLMVQPVADCLAAVRTSESYVILTSPAGNTFNQKAARRLQSEHAHLIIICGHYEGFDERILALVDEEISIGDYVLTGGELAAMVMTDAIVRLVEGVITEASHLDESFENDLLEYPQYTRPASYEGDSIPDVLLSGHHDNVRKWRLKESLRKTWRVRPDLFKNKALTVEEVQLLCEVLQEEVKKD
ncbi:MAG: tRNA (guanosine(37)-N1)-methyltransferase TrmD [Erysipelotrichales bacterium]|nr:MAG: tRNA (guanosine(37)-N1)-methyltransferase TrmD [Erysipelotrichales bacterium]